MKLERFEQQKTFHLFKCFSFVDCSTPDATILDDCSSEESSKVSTVSTQTDGEYKEYKETIKVLNTKNESLKKRVEELEQTLASFKKIFGV